MDVSRWPETAKAGERCVGIPPGRIDGGICLKLTIEMQTAISKSAVLSIVGQVGQAHGQDPHSSPSPLSIQQIRGPIQGGGRIPLPKRVTGIRGKTGKFGAIPPHPRELKTGGTVSWQAVIPAFGMPWHGCSAQDFGPANEKGDSPSALKHSGKQRYKSRWRVGENPNFPVPSACLQSQSMHYPCAYRANLGSLIWSWYSSLIMEN